MEVGQGFGMGRCVDTGLESEFTRCVELAILVHPRAASVQKQRLQKLSPLSFPVQPFSTVSPTVSLHDACVVLGDYDSTVVSLLVVGAVGTSSTLEQASTRIPRNTAIIIATFIPIPQD